MCLITETIIVQQVLVDISFSERYSLSIVVGGQFKQRCYFVWTQMHIYFFKIYTLQRLSRNLRFCCCFSCLLYWAPQRQFSDKLQHYYMSYEHCSDVAV